MYLRHNLGLLALVVAAAVGAWLILRRVYRGIQSSERTTASK